MRSFLVLFLMCEIFVLISTKSFDSDQPWDCPPNEVFYKCSLEKCYEHCKDLEAPKPCPILDANCNKPACMCDSNLFRNREGVCVPKSQCG